MPRDNNLDGLKFFMIYLVVLGHLGYNDYGLQLSKIIYSFHMSVFVFLSGFFTSLKDDRMRQNKWFRKTILIYGVAQIAHAILKLLLSEISGHKESVVVWKILISPDFALWYLVCLVYWRYSVWRILKNSNELTLMFISVILAIVSGFVPIDHNFTFQRAFAFYPFFMLGFVLKKRNLINNIYNYPPYFYTVILLLIGLYIAKIAPWYMPKTHYEDWHDMVKRILQTMLGMYLCLLLIRISRLGFVEKFAKYGKYTLWIYIGHTFLIRIGGRCLEYYNISLNIFEAALLAFAYCMFFIYIVNVYYKCIK